MSRPHYHQLDTPQQSHGIPTLALVGTILLVLLFNYFLKPGLSPLEIVWNVVVYILPSPFLLDSARRAELKANDMLSQTHAAKSDALRRMLGLGGSAIVQSLPTAGDGLGLGRVGRRLSMAAGRIRPVTSYAPAGLGNWDNSCYQNSVLQALASLGSLTEWLRVAEPPRQDGATTTNSALQEMIAKLKDPQNNGRHIWTPAKLKNMSSWQQQDAQEYFSKIVEELDKEAKKAFMAKQDRPGLETILEKNHKGQDRASVKEEAEAAALRNPLEGLLAQRVTCTQCGFSDGYSMIPFNCLTVPLGSQHSYDLEDCLSDYTKSEEIEGVECRSCTLMQAAERLQKLLVNAPFEPEASEPTEALTASAKGGIMSLPAEIRAQISQRLRAVEKALDEDDFNDKTLKQDCQISPKAHASTTKTRQAIIGRAPRTLVVHINRSVFDEITGMQRKNYANVRYPMNLDLRPWMLEAGSCYATYKLSAVVLHYGRHENGHYICYRKHPHRSSLEDDESNDEGLPRHSKEKWWRLSDEDVSPATEDEALGQNGAFMLFYEQIEEIMSISTAEEITQAAAVPLPPDQVEEWDALSREPSSTATPSLVTSSAHSVVSESDTEYETEVSNEPFASIAVKLPPEAPLLKTASPIGMKDGLKDLHQLSMARV